MAISAGTRFGAYEVLEPIGSGGMGEVWRARDTGLKREVAVKVLPESFAADADRLARFRREAEILASLNHPNIAQVHGLETIEDHLAIVMELVEGPTLADRIAQGPIPPDEALGIARQIADALEAAHARQIVHRDLKPANIKLKDDGTVRVLDFGISKPIDANEISGSQLATPAVTETGVILGTAAYMSPEQARGRFVDERTDIWAFGCLLFEMLTGQPAFGGEDVMATLARVIDRDTDLSSIPQTISPAVRQTIKLCLIKDPRKRIADIRDVRLALAGEFESELPAPDSAAMGRTDRRLALPVIASVIATGVVAATVGWVLWPEPPRLAVQRFTEPLPDGAAHVAISPDGTHLGFGAFPLSLHIRRLDARESEQIPGARAAGFYPPCFSPDASLIAYFDSGTAEIRRIPVTGGGSLPLIESGVGPARLPLCHWGRDGFIYLGADDGLVRIPEGGGDAELLIDAADVAPLQPTFPQLLPSDTRLLVTLVPPLFGGAGEAEVAVLDLATRELTRVAESAGLASYLPESPGSDLGYLLYGRNGSLFVAPFDTSNSVAGTAVPVLTGLFALGPFSFPRVSENGTLIYTEGRAELAEEQFIWFDRDGVQTPIEGPTAMTAFGISLSPDDERVLATVVDVETRLSMNVWQLELDGPRFTPVTSNGRSQIPVWLSDSERLLYFDADTVAANPSMVLTLDRADGGGTPVILGVWDDLDDIAVGSISPDDRFVVGVHERRGNGFDIWTMALDPEADAASAADRVEYLLESEFQERHPNFSPAGDYIAYTSNRTGQDEVFVTTYPDPGPRTRISVDGGTMPRWNPAGGEIFYLSGSRMMAVEIDTGENFRRGEPEVLFDAPGVIDAYSSDPGSPVSGYGVSSDGTRFLFTGSRGPGSDELRLRIVLNWIEELKQQVPLD